MAEGFPKLVVVTGGAEQGTEAILSGREQFSMGRSDDNDLVLKDNSVSRKHATLSYKNNAWTVRDERSRNGTILNEDLIGADVHAPIANGDIIRLGVYEVRFIEKELSEEEIHQKTSYTKPEAKGPPAADNAEKKNPDQDIPPAQGDTPEQAAPAHLETDKQELQALEFKGYPPEAQPATNRGLWIFSLIALLFCLLGVGLYFLDLGKTTPDETPAQDTPQPAVIPQKPTEAPQKTEVPAPAPANFNVMTTGQGEPKKAQGTPATFSVFLDVETIPLPASIYFEDERIGVSPLKKNVTVTPHKAYTLYADFELRELSDVYRKKVDFKARPDTDVIELKVDAEIGVMKILKLPKRVDFYLEGFYDYDKQKANPVKITDIVYGRPVYLPYGTYVVELREKTQLAGSANLITQIRFQREYTINKEQRVLNLSVDDRELQFFPAVIKSVPGGADVYYGGEKIGTTPYEGNLALGKNQIKILKEGFFPTIIDVDMRMNSVYEIKAELKTSKMGELVNDAKNYLRHEQTDMAIGTLVEALKYGGTANEKAEVYFLLGDSYLTLKDYEQALPYFDKASGHEGFQLLATLGKAKVYHAKEMRAEALKAIVEVLVAVDADTPAHTRSEANTVFKLISPVKSVIYLYSEPAGASVYINDKRISEQTPFFISDLGLGNYRLQFEKAGYQSYKTKQNIKIGEFVLVKVKLEKEQL